MSILLETEPLSGKERDSLVEAVENALIEWSMDNPRQWFLSEVKSATKGSS